MRADGGVDEGLEGRGGEGGGEGGVGGDGAEEGGGGPGLEGGAAVLAGDGGDEEEAVEVGVVARLGGDFLGAEAWFMSDLFREWKVCLPGVQGP